MRLPGSNSIKPFTGTERRRRALDIAFLIEVLSAADRIARLSEAWQPLGEGVRRCRLSRFRYGLIYTINPAKSWCWRSLTCMVGQTIGAIA